jgi:predicted transcriptional regulator
MEDYKARISGFLRDNPKGLSIEELSSRAKLNRQTVKVILAEMKGERKITERAIGRVKLHYWNIKEMREPNGL